MMKMIERVLGYERIVVKENERALALLNGRFVGILEPGEHLMRNRRKGLVVERHSLVRPEFVSEYRDALIREMPEASAVHFTEVRTAADEVALVFRDSRLYAVQKPDGHAVFWTAAGPWSVERVSVVDTLAVPAKYVKRLKQTALKDTVLAFEVQDGQVGVLYVDGDLVSTLGPGSHLFWQVGSRVSVKLIDTRLQSLEVTGQDVLTRDRVTIRVNVSAEYRVTDPRKAAQSAKDYAETFYRALQLAFRKTIGMRSLDQILEDKVTVDAEAAGTVRSEMAALGIEVGEIALKDVILPGEMREILNQVVAAEKEAEANVIRRREETNVTRSLLNTAKVMAENPVMLRLKELEALEKIASKVERLTVHNGTGGLMNEIVKLRD